MVHKVLAALVRRDHLDLVGRLDRVLAEELDPDQYHGRHGRCPTGYTFEDEHCVPSTPKDEDPTTAPKVETKPAKKPKAKPVRPPGPQAPVTKDDPYGLGDLPGGIKQAIGHLVPSKYPPPNIDPSTIKINLSGDSDSHAVMTWRDAKGRVQSAYTEKFQKRHAAHKWERVKALAPHYDKAVDQFTEQLGDESASPRDRDAAAAMLIIAKTGLRPGSASSLKDTGHRGIATLGPENVKVEGDVVKLDFIGKSGKQNVTEVRDPVLAKYLAERIKSPAGGDRLFAASDSDLRANVKRAGLQGFKPKDFRTLMAGKLASDTLANVPDPPPPLPASTKKATALVMQRIREAAVAVANQLNNTPAVARSAYINPAIINAWVKLVGAESLVQTAAMTKPTAEQILKAALDITLPGHDQPAEPLAEDDLQLEADPLPGGFE